MTEINFVDLSTPTARSLLTVEKECIPRVGEWIEIGDSNGGPLFYEVLQVAHSTKYNGADVFVGNPLSWNLHVFLTTCKH